MSEIYALGLHKKPPEIPPQELPLFDPLNEAFEILDGTGRIGWPKVFEYEIDWDDGTRSVAPVYPLDFQVREPSKPSPMPKQMQPRTQYRRFVVYNLARFEQLARTGWLRDPRHTGGATFEEIGDAPVKGGDAVRLDSGA